MRHKMGATDLKKPLQHFITDHSIEIPARLEIMIEYVITNLETVRQLSLNCLNTVSYLTQF